MIREEDDRQLTLILPFGGRLKPYNRWVKFSSVVPWCDLEPAYNSVMNMTEGRPSKPARLVIGAMIIKHKLNISDEETVLQIQENPYLQYFCGYETYIDALPFVPSLFVEIRKRMGSDMFKCFEQAIVDQAVSIQKDKQEAVKSDGDNEDPPASPPSGNVISEVDSVSEGGPEDATHHGRLLMDATVADQMIRFPIAKIRPICNSRLVSLSSISLYFPLCFVVNAFPLEARKFPACACIW